MDNLSYYIRKYNLIPKEVCTSSIEKLKKEEWQPHGWLDYEQQKHVNLKNDLSVLFNSEVVNDLNHFIDLALSLYQQEFKNLIFERSNIRFNKYGVEEKMNRHYDHIRDLFDGNKKGIPVLSILGLLNDDYKGGEFYIVDRKIEPIAGDILIFPSCFLYPHEVKKVIEGTRYSFISWGY